MTKRNRVKWVALIGVSLLGFSAPLAQAALPQAPALAVAGAVDPAAARRFELARQLLEVQGFSAQLRIDLNDMGPLLAQFMKSDPTIAALPAADQAKLSELYLVEIQALVPQMTDKYAAYFASNLSEAELVELLRVYKMPVVQKFSSLSANAETAMDAELGQLGRDAVYRAFNGYIKWKQGQPH